MNQVSVWIVSKQEGSETHFDVVTEFWTVLFRKSAKASSHVACAGARSEAFLWASEQGMAVQSCSLPR